MNDDLSATGSSFETGCPLKCFRSAEDSAVAAALDADDGDNVPLAALASAALSAQSSDDQPLSPEAAALALSLGAAAADSL